MHAREVHAYETLTNGGAVVDLSRSELQKTSFCAAAGPYRAWSRSYKRPQHSRHLYEQYGRTRRNAPVVVFCCDGAVAIAAPINKISCCTHLPAVWRQIRWPAAKGKANVHLFRPRLGIDTSTYTSIMVLEPNLETRTIWVSFHQR